MHQGVQHITSQALQIAIGMKQVKRAEQRYNSFRSAGSDAEELGGWYKLVNITKSSKEDTDDLLLPSLVRQTIPNARYFVSRIPVRMSRRDHPWSKPLSCNIYFL